MVVDRNDKRGQPKFDTIGEGIWQGGYQLVEYATSVTTVVKAPVIGAIRIAPDRRRPENKWEVAGDDFGSNNGRGRRWSTHRDTTDTSVAGTTSEGPRRRRTVAVHGRGPWARHWLWAAIPDECRDGSRRGWLGMVAGMMANWPVVMAWPVAVCWCYRVGHNIHPTTRSVRGKIPSHFMAQTNSRSIFFSWLKPVPGMTQVPLLWKHNLGGNVVIVENSSLSLPPTHNKHYFSILIIISNIRSFP